VLGPLDKVLRLLFALALLPHHADLFLLGGDLQNTGLKLKRTVLIDR